MNALPPRFGLVSSLCMENLVTRSRNAISGAENATLDADLSTIHRLHQRLDQPAPKASPAAAGSGHIRGITMLFRQFFDRESSTYTYLLASRRNGEAVIIDPVKEQLALYRTIIDQLGLRRVSAMDPHIHADHIPPPAHLRHAPPRDPLRGEF